MGWWFGRKSAPDRMRPFVPAWLGTAEEEGFARSVEGMAAHILSTQTTAAYRNGAWEIGVIRADSLVVAGEQVVGARGAAIPDPAGGTTIDAEARSAIGAILAALRQHGLIGS